MVRNAVRCTNLNRRVTTRRVPRISSGVIEPDEVTTGSIKTVYHYDGLNRRTLAQIDLARDSSGGIVTDGNNDPIPLSDLAAGYHYYYNGWSAIETRNGSNQVIKQQVWGTQYIDELSQIAVNDDPGVDDYPGYTPPQGEGSATQDTCETTYYALQGPTYNITGLVDSTGELVERYEYTPYGQRQVYSSCGDNDPALMNPLPISQRVQVSSEDQPYGLCEFGHQGLMHDEATPGLVQNRERMLNTRLGRFAQRDPLGYPDGMNSYAGYHIMGGGVDSFGLENTVVPDVWVMRWTTGGSHAWIKFIDPEDKLLGKIPIIRYWGFRPISFNPKDNIVSTPGAWHDDENYYRKRGKVNDMYDHSPNKWYKYNVFKLGGKELFTDGRCCKDVKADEVSKCLKDQMIKENKMPHDNKPKFHIIFNTCRDHIDRVLKMCCAEKGDLINNPTGQGKIKLLWEDIVGMSQFTNNQLKRMTQQR